jgi:hypothetical protein
VISANWYNQSRSDVILVGLTSQIPDIPDRDQVNLSVADTRMANIIVPCIIRTGKIFTIEKNLVIKTLGRLTPGTITLVIEKVIDTVSGT